MITKIDALSGSEASPSLPSNDGFQTDLISRLANELFAEGRHRGDEKTVKTVPETSGLSRAFPSGAHDTTPPIHPEVESLESKPKSQNNSPYHQKNRSQETHEFGEPRIESFLLGGSGVGRHNRSVSDVDFYFLPKDLNSPKSPKVNDFPSVTPATVPRGLDVASVRKDFPALNQKVHGRPLVWLDNAATTHKPQAVIDATSSFYGRDNSNIHRAAHALAARATDLFEGAREKLQKFVGASDPKQIVFLRGTTEAINLVSQSYGRQNISTGDEIIVSNIEHHANIVPWQLLAEQTGAILRVIPVNDRGEIILEQFAALLSGRTKLVSITHVANALGTITPVEQMIAMSHAFGVPVLVDAAQSAPHLPLNVTALDVDFLVLSGHKVFGPTGIGILYGKSHLLESMPPWQGGGHMIKDVTFVKTTYQNAPEKFEAGTPDIAGAVGLGAAIDYLQGIGMPAIAAYEHELLEYATPRLLSIPGLTMIGTAAHKASVLSFVIDGVEPTKVASHLDKQGIAVRAGHHCALPALRRFGHDATVRASLAFYNNHQDVDAFIHALHTLPRT